MLGSTSVAWAAPPAQPTEVDDLDPPAAEVLAAQPKVDLPAVPDFAVPAPAPDGARTVRGLRFERNAFVGHDVVVTGVVTWIYDCLADVKKPGESIPAAKQRISDDPTLCERAKFHLSDAATDRDEHSLWVVSVPRPYSALEIERIPKHDRIQQDRCEPNDRHGTCPPYKVGDVVTVTGTFAEVSEHSERNSDGLLLYKAMKDTTAKWETPNAAWPPPVTITPQRRLPALTFAKPTGKALRVAIDPARKAESIKHMVVGLHALGAKQFDDAIANLRAATDIWPGNHQAWYYMGGALLQKDDAVGANEALDHAVALRPDAAMYQLWLGIAQFMAASRAARDAQARQANRKPEDVTPDLSTVDFSAAYASLSRAVAIEPALWRAHQYLGRIYRADREAKRAAEELTIALRSNPREDTLYVALGMHYLAFEYTDQALAVASQGVANAPDSALLWNALGLAYADRGWDDKAIEAFGKVIEKTPNNPIALFERGSAYARKHDAAHTRQDFEKFLTVGTDSFQRVTANQQLAKLPHP